MSELEAIETLDRAIEAMLTGASHEVFGEAAELAALAADLRGLPRPDFKKALGLQLEADAAARTSPSNARERQPATRRGFSTVTPYLIVSDVHQQGEFLKRVFGAQGKTYGLGSQGGFHSEYRIGDSMLMMGGGGEGAHWHGTPVPASLHVYVSDVDSVYEEAVGAGATTLMPPTDLPYGERGAAVEDAAGNHWYLATAFGPSYVPEGLPEVMPYLNPRGARQMIQFLETAFDAKQLFLEESQPGVVRHAKMQIGTAIVEIGEAHGKWQPRPMHFMMHVDDCDAAYGRALQAEGAVSISEPANAPYGGRTGVIQDSFGNTWYLSSQTQKKEGAPEAPGRNTMTAPNLFRIALQVADLDRASAFYAKLLNDPGTRIHRGSRHYFQCGPVILALVDVAKGAGEETKPIPDYVYFAVNNLDEVFARAQALNCLAKDRFHDQNAGEIVRRPWGELSFYCEDPWGNGLCFVDETTLFTGK